MKVLSVKNVFKKLYMKTENFKLAILNASYGYAFHKVVLDTEGKIVDYEFLEVNPAFEKQTGLKATDILNKKVTEVLPGISLGEFNWIEYYGEVALTGVEKEFEEYSEQLNKWYKVQVSSPEKFYFSTTFIDITKEKEQSTELESFFSINLDLLCIADLNGNFIKTNKAWSDILGYSTEDLNHKKFLEFVHPDDIQATLDEMVKLGNQMQVLNFVNRYRCKDGTYKFIEWRSQPKGNLIYAAARDITERIENERTLRESEERYRLLFETAHEGIVVAQGTKLVYFNPKFEELTGYNASELSSFDFIYLIYEDDREFLLSKYKSRVLGLEYPGQRLHYDFG